MLIKSFNPCFDGCRPATKKEDKSFFKTKGFNPCFDGCRPATGLSHGDVLDVIRFNPCFDGCRPATQTPSVYSDAKKYVSILVLMDAALRLSMPASVHRLNTQFQSLF